MSPKDVFLAVSARLVARSVDIGRMAATGYSFEEWVNWEAYLACDSVAGWKACPKPGYRHHGCPDTDDLADLSVETESENSVIVEIAIVHDETGDKWKAKIDHDKDKLSTLPQDRATPLQILVAVSVNESVQVSAVWTRWLSQTSLFKERPPTFSAHVPLSTRGQLVVYGWGD